MAVPLVILTTVLWIVSSSAIPSRSDYKIAALFDKDSSQLLPLFKQALSTSASNEKLDGIVLHLDGGLQSYAKVCRAFQSGLVGLLDLRPQKIRNELNIPSLCDTFEIPFIHIASLSTENTKTLSLTLHPEERYLAKAFYDVLKELQWKNFYILYERDTDLPKYREVLRQNSGFAVVFRKLSGPDYRSILREIQKSATNHVVLDCAVGNTFEILRQAQQLGLMRPPFQCLLTSLSAETVHLSTFVFDHAKIISFRLIDYQAVQNMQPRRTTSVKLHRNVSSLTIEEALIFDSVSLLAAAVRQAAAHHVVVQPVSCDEEIGWSQGTEFFNLLTHTEIHGLTGLVQFDTQNRRTNFSLDVIQVTEDGFDTVGKWSTENGLVLEGFSTRKATVGSIKGKILRAITVIEEPYVMLKKDHESRIGNDKFEGYAVDLMNRIAEELGFNFTLENKVGLGHGVIDLNGEWNGLIRELIDKRGDIAVGGITISHAREQVIDFTKPFMHLGISILFRKPEAKPPDLFSFLHPFTTDVWLYILVAGTLVSFSMFVLARFSPYEWYNPHPCDDTSDVVENQFTVGNSLWFTIGSIMQQGSDIAPRAVSTRIVAGCWWFFTLIMIASYTANLAAFLAVERTDQPIKSADDLAKQTEIKYGSYKGGATYNFFKGSRHPVYQKMWAFMNIDQNNFVTAGSLGINKVLTEKYAYLMESPSLEYTVNQHCDLQQVGGLLDSKGFGLATPQNSPYRDEISKAILRMQENSELEVLKDKWWKGKAQICGASAADATSEMGLANVGGVFVVLAGGIIMAAIFAVVEFMWKVRKMTRITQRTFTEELPHAFKNALHSTASPRSHQSCRCL